MIKTDVRGEIYEIKEDGFDQYHLSLITTLEKGQARGGHSHPYEEKIFILKGSLEHHQLSSTKTEFIQFVSKGNIITNQKNVPHYVIAKAPSIFIEWREEEYYSAKNYKPFRSIVERLAK